MYQRGKIQEESLYYESRKHDGSLPIVGVNTFRPPEAERTEAVVAELIRSTEGEKNSQVSEIADFRTMHEDQAKQSLQRLSEIAARQGNVFAELMEAVKVCSLGQITHALYDVGGQYRRNM
jgi:methylmalonyl-CoA mutase